MIDFAEVLKEKERELERLQAEVEVLREAQRICLARHPAGADLPNVRLMPEPAAKPPATPMKMGRRFP